MELAGTLAQWLLDHHPQDAAVKLEGLSLDDTVQALGGTQPAAVARVLQGMSPHRAVEILQALPRDGLAVVLQAMPTEMAARLLRRTDAAFRLQVIESLEGRQKRNLSTLLRYAADSAASSMDPHVLALSQDITVEEAIEQVRDAAQHVLFNVYVVDTDHVLVGVLNLRELLMAEPQEKLAAIMKPAAFQIAADANRQAIFAHPGWREVHSLPVVDSQGRLLGALRYRTLQRLQREAALVAGNRRETIDALGELFWTGAAGALHAATIIGRNDDAGQQGHAEDDDHA